MQDRGFGCLKNIKSAARAGTVSVGQHSLLLSKPC